MIQVCHGEKCQEKTCMEYVCLRSSFNLRVGFSPERNIEFLCIFVSRKLFIAILYSRSTSTVLLWRLLCDHIVDYWLIVIIISHRETYPCLLSNPVSRMVVPTRSCVRLFDFSCTEDRVDHKYTNCVMLTYNFLPCCD